MNRSNINDISTVRRRKRQERTLFGLIVVIISVIIVAAVVSNFDTVVAPLEGVGQRVINNTRSLGQGGFPVNLPGNADSIEGFGDDGFMLISPTYLYAYHASGATSFTRRHGYSFPKTVANGERVLVYDQGGRRLSVFDVNGLVHHEERDENNRIIYAMISGRGSIAVVERTVNHANLLSIYNSDGDWRYSKRFSDDVMQVAFIDEANVAVTTISTNAGELSAAVYFLDLSCNDADAVVKMQLPEGMLPLASYVHADKNSLLVLLNLALQVVDISGNDANSLGNSVTLNGGVVDYAFCGNTAAVLVNDPMTGRANLLVFDHEGEFIGGTAVATSASQVEFYGSENIAVLEAGRLVLYDNIADMGDGTRDTMPTLHFQFQEDYTRFVPLDNDEFLLLGYATVEKYTLQITEIPATSETTE
jgi:hypothetical protein